MSEIILTEENFNDEVINSDKPVLVDFWASWCGPCKMLSPVISEIANENQSIKVGKINVDEQQKLAYEYGIQSIPTLVLFKDGKPVDTSIGYVPKSHIEDMIK